MINRYHQQSMKSFVKKLGLRNSKKKFMIAATFVLEGNYSRKKSYARKIAQNFIRVLKQDFEITIYTGICFFPFLII
jgi:hypothetical protein